MLKFEYLHYFVLSLCYSETKKIDFSSTSNQSKSKTFFGSSSLLKNLVIFGTVGLQLLVLAILEVQNKNIFVLLVCLVGCQFTIFTLYVIFCLFSQQK